MTALEQRIFRIGALMIVAGSLLSSLIFGARHGISFLAGGLLAAISMAWLRHTVNAIVYSDRQRSITRVVGGFVLRLLLIPLCLYAMMRFLYMGIIAAVAGFAVFNCSIFVEGLYEAFRSSKDDPGTE
jgi:hypothetical protein